MTEPVSVDDGIKAAMGVARALAEGVVSPIQLEASAASKCRALFGAVVGPGDPLWELQCEVARQVLALGGVPAGELHEWAAVGREREGLPPIAAEPAGGAN